MNRREFEQHLASHGCELHRHGAKHDIWRNKASGAKSPVPRHRAMKKAIVRGVCRKLDIPIPDGL
jgi:mRNA interferase HicA